MNLLSLSLPKDYIFFKETQIHERKNRHLLASHFLCEGLTPALSLYTSCHLLSWYSHKVVCKITYMHEYIIHQGPDVYSLSFQGQECSVTNADGIMETSQTISSRITDEHTSQLFFSFLFIIVLCFCLSCIMCHLKMGRANIFPDICQDFLKLSIYRLEQEAAAITIVIVPP